MLFYFFYTYSLNVLMRHFMMEDLLRLFVFTNTDNDCPLFNPKDKSFRDVRKY